MADEGTDEGERFLKLKEVERAYIVRALKRSRWKVSGPGGAAELLGLKQTTLYSKMSRMGIKREVTYVVNRP